MLVLQRSAFRRPLTQPLSFRREAFCAAVLPVWRRSPTAHVLLRSTRACGVGMPTIPGPKSRADVSSDPAITPDVMAAHLTARFDVGPRFRQRHRLRGGGLRRR